MEFDALFEKATGDRPFPITASVGFGYLDYSGKAYLAAPLGRFKVQGQPNIEFLNEVDPWLGDSTPLATRTEPDRTRNEHYGGRL